MTRFFSMCTYRKADGVFVGAHVTAYQTCLLQLGSGTKQTGCRMIGHKPKLNVEQAFGSLRDFLTARSGRVPVVEKDVVCVDLVLRARDWLRHHHPERWILLRGPFGRPHSIEVA